MKRILGYIAAALAVLSLLLLVPSEDALGEIVPIPLDPKAVGPEINEKYYLSDTLYEDPSLHVELETGRMFDSAYIVARIRIADPSQIRSVMSTLDGKGTTKAKNMVKRANGVFAINGDFFRKNQGMRLRAHQGAFRSPLGCLRPHLKLIYKPEIDLA